MRILVVDDIATMRQINRNLLRELGFRNIEEADDGNSAWPLLQSGSFDFLITGGDMPGMPGIDLLKAVRNDSKLKDLPVLMVTSEAMREQIIQAAEAGVSGYIVKPFAVGTLREKLEKIFAKAEKTAAEASA